jgi:FtsP/CotA-like multicopper oxidase with cupredoxin domain
MAWSLGVAAGAFLCAAAPAGAADLKDPPVFASSNGVLDLLLVARPGPIGFAKVKVDGWVYELCQRPKGDKNVCPPNTHNVEWYGGTRLQLQQGDTLKIRLVNKLPKATNAKHALDPGLAYLALNPTNLHTHGMLVSAHYPTLARPNYGDNVFVLTLNSANGPLPAGAHIHGDVRYDFTDYEIKIPKDHPSGLFWFHPHAHGVALNQVSSGMAGIITVGSPGDYICHTKACGRWLSSLPVRHLILKDTQILATGQVVDQQDPAFCPQRALHGSPKRDGNCIGSVNVEEGPVSTATPIPGWWYFTINGQAFPTIPVAAPVGEIWRITNTSASVAYDLVLHDKALGHNMLMQVVAIDGVSVGPASVVTDGELSQIGGTKFELAPCPPVPAANAASADRPICARRLVMFPSSRVEVWVTYRDAQDMPATPPAGAAATFLTRGMSTGPGGDAWPRVNLADVTFHDSAPSSAVPPTLTVQGEALALTHPSKLAAELKEPNKLFAPEVDCKPLAPGHKRRIFFNSIPPQPAVQQPPVDIESPFGLGYEELDEHGKPVPGTFLDVAVFDPQRPTVCLTLGPGNTPAIERWELVNLAPEDHNFHMHQTKFRLVSTDEIAGAATPRIGVLHDNVPIRHATGTCNSVDDWRQGRCTAHPVTVEIPFTVPGDYVYHCHILEHEDGGMMARIRVRTNR